MKIIGDTFFEKLTFWLAISMIPTAMIFGSYTFLAFEILFILLWIGGSWIK